MLEVVVNIGAGTTFLCLDSFSLNGNNNRMVHLLNGNGFFAEYVEDI